MSDHYCCKRCGFRYDNCTCPPFVEIGNRRVIADNLKATDLLAGTIAYQLTKRMVIDISTARAAVDAAFKELGL